jgi:hypothetical protein
MLQQPMKEKLHALRLHGMIEAIERQEQPPVVAAGAGRMQIQLRVGAVSRCAGAVW